MSRQLCVPIIASPVEPGSKVQAQWYETTKDCGPERKRREVRAKWLRARAAEDSGEQPVGRCDGGVSSLSEARCQRATELVSERQPSALLSEAPAALHWHSRLYGCRSSISRGPTLPDPQTFGDEHSRLARRDGDSFSRVYISLCQFMYSTDSVRFLHRSHLLRGFFVSGPTHSAARCVFQLAAQLRPHS